MNESLPERMASSSECEISQVQETSRNRTSYFMSLIRTGLAHMKRKWKILLVGQILSLLLAANGFANATLNFECNISIPNFQVGLMYFILSFHLFFIRTPNAVDSSSDDMLNTYQFCMGKLATKGSPLLYLGMAFLDAQANFLTILAFRFTTLISVSLIDALAIPSAMFFSRLILGRKYKPTHLLGSMICVLGVAVNILGDYWNDNQVNDDDNQEVDKLTSQQALGDFLALCGALLYGLNDVLTERVVKNIGPVNEYLGMVGLFGCIICFLQSLILERYAILSFYKNANCGGSESSLFLMTAVIFGVSSYIGMSHFLVRSEAALLNLSLLTGDFWAAGFSIVAEGIVPSAIFWLSLVLVIIGVFTYELSPSPMSVDHEIEEMSSTENHTRLDQRLNPASEENNIEL